MFSLFLFNLMKRYVSLKTDVCIFNTTQHIVLNIDATMTTKIKTWIHTRHGTQRVIEFRNIQSPGFRNPAQSLQEYAITLFGPRLYILLPKYRSDNESLKTEKINFEFDKLLELLLMSSKCSTMSPRQETTASWISYLIGGVEDSASAVKSLTLPRA